MFCTKMLIVMTLVTCLQYVSAWYNSPERPLYRNYLPFYDQQDRCPFGQVKCPTGEECATICDGKSECLYQEDELVCKDQCEVIPTCMKGQMYCPESNKCVGICDGKEECAFGIDEKNCRKKCQYLEMLCPDGKKCATPCDGHPECSGREDESFCPMFDKCNAQYITECLCRVSLLTYNSFDRCSEVMSRHVLSCIEARNGAITFNLEPEEVCSSRSDMEACLCDLISNVCDDLTGPVAACIN